MSRKKIAMNGCKNPLSYDQYIQLHQDIVHRNFGSYTIYEKESIYNYTRDNLLRFEKSLNSVSLDKKLYNHLLQVQGQHWLVLTEPWCGDAAQLIPLFYAISMAQPEIKLTFYLRDENDELMLQALTNGGKAIPKLIAVNKDEEILFDWGPRPKPAQALVQEMKEKEIKGAEFNKCLDEWYEKDCHHSAQEELYQLLKSIN